MELGPAAGKLDVLAVVSTAGGGGGVSHHGGAPLPNAATSDGVEELRGGVFPSELAYEGKLTCQVKIVT
jgi:hypothetical protein